MKKKNEGYCITGKERWAYFGFSFGQIIFYTTMASFVQIFMTDSGIPAAAVGMILLIARIWDAVNDPMFGVIVTRSNLKSGKYRPWLRLAPGLTFAFTILLFALPSSMSAGMKTAWAAVFYICWGMSYTVSDVPYFSVVSVMSKEVSERDNVMSRGRLFTMLGSALVMVIMPNLYPRTGWLFAAAVMAVAALVFMQPFGFVAKERFASEGASVTLKDIFRTLVSNKYLLIFCIGLLIGNLLNTTTTISGYFAIYNLGGAEMIPLITTVPLLGSVVFVGFVPALIKRFDKFHIYLVCFEAAILASLSIYFTGYGNLVVFVILSVIRTTAIMFLNTFIALFIVDCAEYSRYKTGKDVTAASVSLQTFTTKCISAISAAVGMGILGLVGFVDGANAVQPQTVTDTLFFLISIAPIFGLIPGFFILFFGYKLRDPYVRTMALVNRGEMSREEAREKLPECLR